MMRTRFLIAAILFAGVCQAQRRVQIQNPDQQFDGAPNGQRQDQFGQGNQNVQRQQNDEQPRAQDQLQAEPEQFQERRQQPIRFRPQDPVEKPQQRQYNQEPRTRETTTYIPIIRFDKEQGEDGSYKAAWETGNNIIAQEEGFIKDLGPDPDSEEGQHINAQVQQGSYSYTSPEGQIITVNYIADEKGFHPTGDHLPTPPPVSPEVQKGLDLIYAGIRAQQEAAEREAKERPFPENRQQNEQERPRQHHQFAPNSNRQQQNFQQQSDSSQRRR